MRRLIRSAYSHYRVKCKAGDQHRPPLQTSTTKANTMNIFAFTGNLGSNAEQRYTQSGDSIVSFNVAVKAGFGDKAVTTWVKCNLWGKRGDSVLPYLNKGQLVGISGELANRKWHDKDGQDRYSLEVRVNELDLLGIGAGRAAGKGESSHAPEYRNTPDPQKGPPSTFGFDDLGDDVPF